ncbi:hypothetical protein [Candidatus Reidiella endopervernicosa]|uniref:Uncharacterized protein n=1 Tax=Candidatus Reidiella endopervernicosa TaxID=2738883 RepID=A0A6N0HZP3_9GAMM|nr:hypothetical protein [Candidatus Reidiella endopervernicosa]QKQ27828.1 hypothetical protein HUE57_17215 [Candidatus Reidiella endopervernicosa]
MDVIGRVKSLLPSVDVKVWTHNDYRNNACQIICELLGEKIKRIPVIAPPVRTMTPSFRAVSEVEDMALLIADKPAGWELECARIYENNLAHAEDDKYTFLDDELIFNLRARFQDDLRMMSKLWPDDIISVSEGGVSEKGGQRTALASIE